MALGFKTNTVQTGGSTVSAGTAITGFSSKACMYDRGVQQTTTPRILSAKFGDGYELRFKDGINHTPRTWAISFGNRTKADIDNIYDFFNQLATIDTCKLTVPNQNESGDEETVTVVVEGYNKVFTYDDYYSLSCSAREVFEA